MKRGVIHWLRQVQDVTTACGLLAGSDAAAALVDSRAMTCKRCWKAYAVRPPLTRAMRRALIGMRRKWKPAPVLVTSGTLLALQDRKLVECKIAVRNATPYILSAPYTSEWWHWRHTLKGRRMAAELVQR